MYKVTYNICTIANVLKVKISIVTKGDELEELKSKFPKKIEKLVYYGSTYLKYSVNPFVTLDISKGDDSNSSYNPNNHVNLNNYLLFKFVKTLSNIRDKFVKIEDLYIYDRNGTLVMNKDKAKQIVTSISGLNKTIHFIPTIVKDQNNENIFHEGIVMYFNTVDNYCELTFEEIDYLLYILNKINLTESGMLLLLLYNQEENVKNDPVKLKVKPIIEQKEIVDNTPIPVLIQKQNTIPDI